MHQPRAVVMRQRLERVAESVAQIEQSARALLNLGHTFGHALEAESGFGEALKHGEAVALGCAMAFRFSARLGLCAETDSARADRFIAGSGLPSRLADLDGGFSAGALLARMGQDKKARAGGLTFILARGIGAAFVAGDVDLAAVRAFLLDEGAVA